MDKARVAMRLVNHLERLGSTARQLVSADVSLVWFTQSNGNWEAFATVTGEPNKIYKLSHDCVLMETRIDTYQNINSTVTPY